ncbi:MAG: LysM peptidoglycan-binding domain-containing protein [Thermodesulfobacteriota bacterium]
MGNVVIIAIVFIGLSMAMPWVIGNKERTELSEKLEETKSEKKSVEKELVRVEKDLEKEIVKVKEVKEKLQQEMAEKAEVEEMLLQTEKRLDSSGEDVKRLTKMAHVDEDEAKEIAIEEAQKRVEIEAQLQAEAEARREAENRWLRAELDRARAEERLFQKAEELAVVRAEYRMLENLRDDDKMEYVKLRQKLEEGTADEAAKMRIRAEDELDAQLAVLKEREAALMVELKEAFREKEEVAYRLKKEELLRQVAEGKITELEMEAALRKEKEKGAAVFPEEKIFGYGLLSEQRTGEGWWIEEVIRYRVKEGDYLSKIAAQDFVFGNGNLWVIIYKYNLHRTKNPHLIYPGQLLLIPKIISKKEIRKLIRNYYREEKQKEGETEETAG